MRNFLLPSQATVKASNKNDFFPVLTERKSQEPFYLYADIPNRPSSPTNVQLHDPDNRYKMGKRYFYSPQRKSDFDP